MSTDAVLTREVIVKLPDGLHLRPISQIARLVVISASELTVRKGPQTANAQSPLELMALCAVMGDKLTLEARGEDAAELLDAVIPWFDVVLADDVDAG